MANREVEEITPNDVGQAEDILGSSVEEEAEKIVLTHDWAPLKSEFAKLAGHAEVFIEEILEKIPNLTVSRSKGQNVCLRFLGKAPVLRMWFNTRAITCNVISLEGKAAVESKSNSFKMGANGFPKKTRNKILALVRKYVKARREMGDKKFLIPEAEAVAALEQLTEEVKEEVETADQVIEN